MRRWLEHRRALIGYLLLAVIAIVGLDLHHTRTTNELREDARQTCQAVEEVTANQEFVLQTLTLVIAHQAAEGAGAPDLLSRLEMIEKRSSELPKYDCSSELVQIR